MSSNARLSCHRAQPSAWTRRWVRVRRWTPGLPSTQDFEEIERAHILAVLEACQWRIKGAGQAAERLGLHPSTLYSRMKKLGIARQP